MSNSLETALSGGIESRTAARAAADETTVLHVFRYFRPDFTGDGIYFEKLIPLLEQRGVRNEVIAGVTPAARGVPARKGVRLFGRYGTPYFNPAMLLWLLFNAWRFDVIHLHCAIDRLFAYHVIAALFGCRVVQSCTLDDGLSSIIAGYRPAYRGLVRRLCGLIDDVVTISPRLHDDTVAALPRSRVHLIQQGVNIPHREPAEGRGAVRARLGVGPDDVLLLFVGGIVPRKDAMFLVQNHPADLGRVHLMLVGPVLDDAYAASLRKAIADSPAAARIHVAGYMEDPTSAFQAADAFVFASHREGCPNVLLEAMANGLPIISRRLPGTTDAVVEHDRTGILFDTAPEYTAAVERLAGSVALRQSMGGAAHASVCRNFEMDAVAGRYAALYRQG